MLALGYRRTACEGFFEMHEVDLELLKDAKAAITDAKDRTRVHPPRVSPLSACARPWDA